MKIAILHTKEAADPPEDPLLPQLEQTLATLKHEVVRIPVDQ